MVTVINRFTVTGEKGAFERVLGEITGFMTSQPGFLSHGLYHSVRNDSIYIETAQWEDAKSHQAAMQAGNFSVWIGEIAKHATVEPDVFEEIEPAQSTQPA